MIRRVVLMIVWGIVVAGGSVAAQPDPTRSAADPYFHEAAQAYIDNDLPAARRAVAQGLEVAPSDARLQALRERLRQTRQSDREPDRSSDSEQRQQQSGEQGESAADEGRSASDTGDRERQQPGQAPESSDGSGQRAPSGEEQPAEEQDGQEQRRMGGDSSGDDPRPARQLSRVQAEQLLRALEMQEQQLLRTLKPRDGDRPSVEKDW